MYKSKLCRHFEAGSCEAGPSCGFAHGMRELRAPENPLYKVQLCTAFQQNGDCLYQETCLFAHGENDLRSDDVMSLVPSVSAPSSAASFSEKSPISAASSVIGSKKDTNDSYKTAFCIHWAKHGKCSTGNACNFAHGKEELRNYTAPDPNDPKYKTKLCIRFEQEKFCPNGEMCIFAHGECELRVDGVLDKKSALFKTSLCHNYLNLGGVCPSGKNCQFAHGRFELRPVGFTGDFDAKITENSKWKCALCKQFLSYGACNRENCDFAHGEDEMRCEQPDPPNGIKSNWKTVLCNRFLKEGYCHLGGSCSFAHGDMELRGAFISAPVRSMPRGPRKRPTGAQTLPQHEFLVGTQMNYSTNSPAQLFQEFMEFKKFKEHSQGIAAPAASYGPMQPKPLLGTDANQQLTNSVAGMFAAAHSQPSTSFPVANHSSSHPFIRS